MQTVKEMKFNMKKICINIIIFFLVFSLFAFFQSEEEKDILNKSYDFLSNQNSTNIISEKIIEEKEYPKEKILETYNGYDVCAKLVIPEISLETNVIANYSEEALKNSVVKFWGVEPNNTGNFCIAGHNFKNKNMFSKLKKLKLGDRLFITDKKVGKVEYEIFKINTVLPEDVSCLKAITEGEKEVTLITCTIDSKKRIVVKAKEI